MTIPRSLMYLDLLCGESPPPTLIAAGWPPIVCTELVGHGADHTAHTMGDVDYTWTNKDAPPPPGHHRWWWPTDEIGQLA